MKNIRPTSRFRGLEKQRFRPACRCWSSWPFRRLGHAAIIVIFQLAAVSCCAGAQPLHNVSQPTPALLVATIRSCPATVQQPNGTWGCAYLPVWSTTALQPGPPASFPLLATLSGGPATAAPSTCCDAGSTFQNPPPPTAVSNFTSGDNTTPLLPQLDMSLLAPSSLVVPPNGTLTLTRLNITGAQLPAAPFPLPTTSFLSLLAIRLSPGARLQLSNVIVTTPSCVSLALHQELACRSAPSPNFTVTPTSLMVHSFTTASLSAHDVVLTCSGKQLPAPCTAAVVRSGVEVLRAVTGWVTRGDTPLAPLYLWVQGTVQLSWADADRSLAHGEAVGEDEVPSTFEDSLIGIPTGRVVIGGPPDRSSVLDLTGSSSLFGMQGSGAMRLQNLTLKGLPLGPAITYPTSLMRLPLWTWAFMRRVLGSSSSTLLHVSNVTIELPPEEMAFWRYAPGSDATPPVAAALEDGDSRGLPCCTDGVNLWSNQRFRPVAGCSRCILAVRLVSRSSLSVVESALLVEEGGGTPQEQQQQSTEARCDRQRQAFLGQPVSAQGPTSKAPIPAQGSTADELGEGSATRSPRPGLLQLPPRPCSALCNLLPGAGALEVLGLYVVVDDAYLKASGFGYSPFPAAPEPPATPHAPGSAAAAPSPRLPNSSQLAPAPTAAQLLDWPPQVPTLLSYRDCGWEGHVSPSDLTFTLEPTAVTVLAAVPTQDVALYISDDWYATHTFYQKQAVVELPGCLLLGDPVRVRTLDLAGLPNTFFLEREPLANREWSLGRSEELWPFLDSFRQQRLAAGYRGLLTEPVSLTVRHMVLINLPAAGPFVVRIGPPTPPWPPGMPWTWDDEGRRRRSILASAGDAVLHSSTRAHMRSGARELQQAQETADEPGAAVPAGDGLAAVDYLGGLSPSLANFTSCVWSLQLDRAAVAHAVRARVQQGEVAGGSNDSIQSPVDVSYALLESVQLVVPERELLLLAWAWATNATRHAADPGLAEQLQLMLDGSWLAGGAAALQQLRVSLSSPGAAPAQPAGLRLVFEQLVWCGLLGSNVTLTSQLPGPTELSYQPLDLDLPVAYGNTGPDPPGPQGGPAGNDGAITIPSGPPAANSRSSAPPPGEVPRGNISTGGGMKDANGTTGGLGTGGRQEGAERGNSSGGVSASVRVGLAAGLASGLGVAAAMAVVALVLVRRQRARALQVPEEPHTKLPGAKAADALPPPRLPSASGSSRSADSTGTPCVDSLSSDRAAVAAASETAAQEPVLPSHVSLGILDYSHSSGSAARGSSGAARGSVSTGELKAPGSPCPSHGQDRPSLSPEVRAVVQQATVGMRLHVEQQRHGLQQQQEQQQHWGQVNMRPMASASASPGPLSLSAPQSPTAGAPKAEQGGALQAQGASMPSGAEGTTVDGAAPEAGVVAASVSGTLSLSDVASSFMASLISGRTTTTSVHSSAVSSMGRHLQVDSGGGGGGGGGGSCGGPLVLLRELGRGAQGVVFAGRWRGLDVAVKSVLMQRLVGRGAEQLEKPDGSVGTWHGPSLSTAMAEGSIATAMSHPHVVATYATYVHGPEKEQLQGQQEQRQHQHQHQPAENAATAAGGASAPLGVSVGSSMAGFPSDRTPPHASIPGFNSGPLAVGIKLGSMEGEQREEKADGEMQDVHQSMGRASEAKPSKGELLQLRHQCPLPLKPPLPSSERRSQPGGPGPAQVQVWKLTLVQELCNGGSLRDSLLAGRLARRCCGRWPRALRPGVALRLALHVARGSAHLHRHGVLWNDLAAANVLLHFGSAAQQWQRQQEEQQQQEQSPQQAPAPGRIGGSHSTCSADAASLDFVAKVADFGLSRRLPEDATHASGPAGRSGLYIAPEVVRYGRCTPASDVYAYGVLLWEVAAGVPLPELLPQPEGGAVRSWLAQQALVPPEEAAALPAELLAWPGAGQRGSGGRAPEGAAEGAFLPAGYVALAEQCLQGDPGARPSFEEACARLEEMLVDR